MVEGLGLGLTGVGFRPKPHPKTRKTKWFRKGHDQAPDTACYNTPMDACARTGARHPGFSETPPGTVVLGFRVHGLSKA